MHKALNTKASSWNIISDQAVDDPYACSDVEMDDDVLREFLLQTAETQLPQEVVVQAGVAETAQDGRTNRMSATCYIVAYIRG